MESTAIPPRKNWIKRHSAWAIGIGAVLVAAAFIGAIFFLTGTLLHDSDAVHMAVSTAEANPAVIQTLGTPLETGRFVSGNLEVSDANGHAELSIPISGPRGHGKLYVEARKSAGSWHMRVLQFVADGSQTPIDILPAAPAPDSPK